MSYTITGMQQLGVGVRSKSESWKWFRRYLGMDVPIFQEAAEAPLMFNYTGGKVQSRDAALAVNLKGGSGFEIWEYTSRESQYPQKSLKLGDYGIAIGKIKTPSLEESYAFYQKEKVEILGEITETLAGYRHFYIRDPWGNLFEIQESDDFFQKDKALTGGPCGAVMGVSDIDKVLPLYQDILGYDLVLSDETAIFDDLKALPGGEREFRRVILTHKEERKGPFAAMFGKNIIELIEAKNTECTAIYKDRFWGDAGFIHLCFDVTDMDDLEKILAEKSYPFTVDSKNSFDMGEAAGRFSYIEDPDGTLIEFVETHKIPVIKKIGWYINLEKRDPKKSLPSFVIKLLGLARIK